MGEGCQLGLADSVGRGGYTEVAAGPPLRGRTILAVIQKLGRRVPDSRGGGAGGGGYQKKGPKVIVANKVGPGTRQKQERGTGHKRGGVGG